MVFAPDPMSEVPFVSITDSILRLYASSVSCCGDFVFKDGMLNAIAPVLFLLRKAWVETFQQVLVVLFYF